MRTIGALIASCLTASLCFGCASAELPQDGSDASPSDDGGDARDVGEDVVPETDARVDVRPPQDTDDPELCVPATCAELSACGSADDGCGGTLSCGTCPDVAQILLSPSGNQTLQVGEVLELSAVATESSGAETFCEFQWTSQDPTVARVDSSGEVSGLAPGITEVRVTCRGGSARVRLYVNDSGLSSALTDSTDLAIWLRADVGLNFSGGAQVEQWEDLSGNAYVVANDTFSRQPRRINNALNAKPVLRFTGTQELRTTTTYVGLSEATVFAVVQNNEASHRGQILSNCNDGGNNQFRFEGTANDIFFYGVENGLSEIVTLEAPTTSAQLLSVVLSNAELRVYQNTQAQVSVSRSTLGTWNLGQVGARCSSEFLRGDIAELMVYRDALADAQREQVEAYLMGRYGL